VLTRTKLSLPSHNLLQPRSSDSLIGAPYSSHKQLTRVPRFSPEGTRIAFTARDSKGQVLYVRALNSLVVQPLAGTDGYLPILVTG
jgi:hypothetical protein